MPRSLTEDQIAFFRDEGYLPAIDALPREDAAALCEDLGDFEHDYAMSAADISFKGHLCFRRSYEFSFHDRILDVVEDLIGPNILAFASRFWMKKGNDGTFVSWHQDSAYFGLDPHELVTVWLALTDSTPEMGCMRVMPGSHLEETRSHVETYDKKNLLLRGQSIEGLDESRAVDLILKTGQFSCHHERIIHGSAENATDRDRCGLAIFYMPTQVKSVIGRRTACLVRGVDEYNHWDADPAPKDRIDRQIIDHIQAAARRYTDPKFRQEAEAT